MRTTDRRTRQAGLLAGLVALSWVTQGMKTDYFDPDGTLSPDTEMNDYLCARLHDRADTTGISPPPIRTYAHEAVYPWALAGSTEKYTILINTFQRYEAIQGAVRAYEKCPGLDRIHIVWSESPSPPQDDPSLQSPHVEVILHGQPSTSFLNRFKPLPGIRTPAVLSLDDDIRVPCGHIQNLFDEWKKYPEQLVGPFARGHDWRWNGEECEPSYTAKQPRKSGDMYSIVLTKMAFMHRDWLSTFTEWAPDELTAYIDAHRNCEVRCCGRPTGARGALLDR